MDDNIHRMIKPDFSIEFEEILLDESYESEPSNIKKSFIGRVWNRRWNEKAVIAGCNRQFFPVN